MKAGVTIHYSEAGLRHRPLVEQVAREGIPAAAEIIYRGRNVVAAIPSADIVVNIKAFSLPNIVNRYVYGRLRRSKAMRSYVNSLRLRDLGFNVPAPLAYIEERGNLTFGRSYFISEHVGDITEMRYPERFAFVTPLLEALGREMARLHRAGVWMKDFSPGNVLFKRLPDGAFTFYYVDLNRIRFDTFSRSKLDRMWERLLFDKEQIAVAARSYAAEMGLDADEVYRGAVARWSRYVASKSKKNKNKQ